jgi:hypothetical protein
MAMRKAFAAFVVLAVLAGSSGAQAAPSARGRTAAAPAALRRSLNLWATIDVCNASDQPNTIGVRGSMPGDRVAGDAIFMRFRLQYVGATGTWVNLNSGVSPFLRVASAKAAHEDGWSVQLRPGPHKLPTTWRGVVTFQWRRGTTVLASISRATTAHHEGLTGADPPNYSAATCAIG